MDEDFNPQYYLSGNIFRSFNCHNGPCYITMQGDVWFVGDNTGVSGRDKGPSCVWPTGYLEFTKKGVLHRTNGPAIIKEDGSVEYWVEGVKMTPFDYFIKLGVM